MVSWVPPTLSGHWLAQSWAGITAAVNWGCCNTALHPRNLLFFCLPFWVFPEPGGGWPMSHFGCVCNSHLFSVLRRLKSLWHSFLHCKQVSLSSAGSSTNLWDKYNYLDGSLMNTCPFYDLSGHRPSDHVYSTSCEFLHMDWASVPVRKQLPTYITESPLFLHILPHVRVHSWVRLLLTRLPLQPAEYLRHSGHREWRVQLIFSLISLCPTTRACSIFVSKVLLPSSDGQPTTVAITGFVWW